MELILDITMSALLGAAHLVLLWKLFRVDAAREYRFFAVLQAWLVACSVVMWGLIYFAGNRTLYAKTWFTIEIFTSVLILCALLETFNLVLSEFRGFQRLGQRLIRVSLIISAVMIALLWVPFSGLENRWAFSSFEGRTVYLSLTLTATGFGLFAAYFRVRVSRNTMCVFAVLLGLLVSKGAAFASRLYFPKEASDILLYSASCWELLWIVVAVASMSVQGRIVPRPSLAVAASGAEVAAAERLEVMNGALGRILRQ